MAAMGAVVHTIERLPVVAASAEAGPVLRRAIAQGLAIDELREVVADGSLHTLRDSALELVAAGKIPLGELPQLLPQERLAPAGSGRTS